MDETNEPKTIGEMAAAAERAKRRPKKEAQPKTAREIQAEELRRRKKKADSAEVDDDVGTEAEDAEPDDPPFVKETIAASASAFCWFCFECERELLVVGKTGVHFCLACATSLVQLATEDGESPTACWFCFSEYLGTGSIGINLVRSVETGIAVCEVCLRRCFNALSKEQADGPLNREFEVQPAAESLQRLELIRRMLAEAEAEYEASKTSQEPAALPAKRKATKRKAAR